MFCLLQRSCLDFSEFTFVVDSKESKHMTNVTSGRLVYDGYSSRQKMTLLVGPCIVFVGLKLTSL